MERAETCYFSIKKRNGMQTPATITPQDLLVAWLNSLDTTLIYTRLTSTELAWRVEQIPLNAYD